MIPQAFSYTCHTLRNRSNACGGEFVWKELQGDVATELQVFRLVYHTPMPPPTLLLLREWETVCPTGSEVVATGGNVTGELGEGSTTTGTQRRSRLDSNRFLGRDEMAAQARTGKGGKWQKRELVSRPQNLGPSAILSNHTQ